MAAGPARPGLRVLVAFDDCPSAWRGLLGVPALHAESVVLLTVLEDCADLGLEATRRGDGEIDSGQAAFIEVTIDGSPRIVWLIDLPSDPSIPRHVMLRLAGEKIGAHNDGAGFPEPDVIVGDFNTPRGSRSLGNIVGDADSAFDRAGSGWSATWPRAFPLWHIDQVFVDDAVSVRAHRVLDMGLGEHRGVIVDLDWKP